MDLPVSVSHVLTTLKDNGHEAYVVGGAVRNSLLGLEAKDYDVATSAHPNQVEKIFSNTKLVGEKFGVTLVQLQNEDIEVATFRKEGKYEDHRRPSVVTFGSRDEDAQRRDFTINCMFYGLDGWVYDPYDGQRDIRNRLIKCVGNPHERLNEDALRIMRGIRFAAQLGFSIDPETFEAMKIHATDLILIAQERVRSEFDKILVSSDPVRGIQYLMKTGAMKFVIPELYELAELQQGNQTVLEHTLEVVKNSTPTVEKRLAALLHDIGKPRAVKKNGVGKNQFVGHDIYGCDLVRERLRSLTYNNQVINSVSGAIRLHMRLRFSTAKKTQRKLIYDCKNRNTYDILCDLLVANDMANYGGMRNSKSFVEWSVDPELFFKPALPVDGFDLQEIGIKGRLIGYTLDRIRDKWFANTELTYDEAIQIARSIYANPPKEMK